MGLCVSNGIKGYTRSTELNSRNVRRDGKNLGFEFEILRSPNLKNFSFSELQIATRNFRSDGVLGEGTFGPVYKGWIDGMVIAVKRLNRESFRGYEEWMNYNAKLSGFALARDGPTDDESYVTTTVMGTYEFAAPEYLATGRLNAKCDVYSFGVVLLEILSGRRAIDSNVSPEHEDIVEWAKPYLTNKRTVFRVLDTRLGGQHFLKRARKLANLALHCLNDEPKLRPDMEDVVMALESLQESN